MVATKIPADPRAQPVIEEPRAEEAKQRNKCVVFIFKILKIIIDQWLIIGFGLACLFGYLWPNVAATGGVLRSQYSILYGAVAIIFLISGLQLSPQKLRQNVFNWRLHILTQGISFVVIPLIWLAIMWIIIAAGDLHTNVLDVPILLGMLVLSCLPTTIASNVVMTRNAGGDDAAAIIEVVLGNVFGSFLCPLLIYGFMPNRPEFQSWSPASLSGLSTMYQDVGMQLGLSVLLPIMVGQTLRVLFEDKVMWCLQTFYLAKISTFFLCTLAWTTFSNAFKTGAIYQLPKGSIIFNIIMNVVLYGLFTVICFTMARPPLRLVAAFGEKEGEEDDDDDEEAVRPRGEATTTTTYHSGSGGGSGKGGIMRRISSTLGGIVPRRVRRVLAPKRMSKEQTVAVCFCGAAKTTSVGIPLVSAMWAQKDDLTRASLAIPVLLYTMEQVFLAQILVYGFRRYLRRGEGPEKKAAAVGVDVELAHPPASAPAVGMGEGKGIDEAEAEAEGAGGRVGEPAGLATGDGKV